MTASALPLSRLLPERQGLPDVAVNDLSMSSLGLVPGAAFVALRGTRAHGLDFASRALEQGAVAVLWDEGNGEPPPDPRFVHVPQLRRRLPELARRLFGAWPEERPLIAITGTDGKTSVSHQLSTALTHLGLRCAVIGTLGVGTPETLSPTGHTTPDVLELHRHLAELARAGFDAVALEASSHALVQGRLEGLRPRVAVLTHLGRDHLDYHGSLAAYADAKALLFRTHGLHAMVLNLDDELGRRLLAEHCTRPGQPGCWTYGQHDAPDLPGARERHIQARNINASVQGLRFEVQVGPFRGQVNTPLFGAFQVANLLATLGTLLALGQPPARAFAALSAVRGVPGRMERFIKAGGPVLVVDYAHTARALESVLLALRPHVVGRLWVVFGCGGNRDRGKRPAMGEVAARLSDEVIVTDDNPRDESPAAIRRAVLDGCAGPAPVREIGDRAQAIRTAMAEAEAGDIVLIAGKGHEAIQIIAGVEHPFSDRELALRLTAGGGQV
ncbi:UDP-N-acetylmuramoyl-L-alanyl-D-glutamate--2,6-diaminopimelate ligase [Thioalkalivibrio sp.]|uniref:UDP-N-acetylmuramoyl-L-alanyl-D-glutamate--2, 6-diaminopimelate ligase n=1 Tax=Thioalkalivibrio sp. TaxID=2093813 RepID=UPI0012D53FC8|nr:UDP-N-acetylmuramoyl-L-alanyl-D-glutamate--2,6-diaminopimelate ligase [Thioalkalivibrio sp.]TVP79623.1 MAG: UDP-N-acetylmuramoyl-L-alanyl-D-glutamate--2,6-diaminopimelate ligase [Thioalkalivibrio sp.]